MEDYEFITIRAKVCPLGRIGVRFGIGDGGGGVDPVGVDSPLPSGSGLPSYHCH